MAIKTSRRSPADFVDDDAPVGVDDDGGPEGNGRGDGREARAQSDLPHPGPPDGLRTPMGRIGQSLPQDSHLTMDPRDHRSTDLPGRSSDEALRAQAGVSPSPRSRPNSPREPPQIRPVDRHTTSGGTGHERARGTPGVIRHSGRAGSGNRDPAPPTSHSLGD